jgi:hypothetical protein
MARPDKFICIQVLDSNRAWNGRDEKKFSAVMRELAKQRFSRQLHSTGKERSLHMHFNVLRKFVS